MKKFVKYKILQEYLFFVYFLFCVKSIFVLQFVRPKPEQNKKAYQKKTKSMVTKILKKFINIDKNFFNALPEKSVAEVFQKKKKKFDLKYKFDILSLNLL